MKEILNYYAKSLSRFSKSLKKKGILVDQPWALIDEDNQIQKLIFKNDNNLILSKNGKVVEGKWEYFAQSKVMLIDRGTDKLLLKEQYIDDNVLLLKKDGTDSDFLAFANENSLPDYNVLKYLNEKKRTEFKINERKLFNGQILQIYEGAQYYNKKQFRGLKAGLINEEFNSIKDSDGTFLSENKEVSYVIKDGEVKDVIYNLIKEIANGGSFEIENGTIATIDNLGKRVFINGTPISDTKLIDLNNTVYTIKDSVIKEIVFVKEYITNDKRKIIIEQRDIYKIRKGDFIVEYNKQSHIPDGSYKIKGKFRKIRIIDNKIV